jgi:hypothetical protein
MKPEGLKLLGRATCRWENCIKIGIKGTGWEGVSG